MVVLKPLRKEVDWIGRLGFVHDSHSLGNDHSQVGALEVLGVRNSVNHHTLPFFLYLLEMFDEITIEIKVARGSYKTNLAPTTSV